MPVGGHCNIGPMFFTSLHSQVQVKVGKEIQLSLWRRRQSDAFFPCVKGQHVSHRVFVPLHRHAHTAFIKKRGQKPLQKPHCLVCPAPGFILHWMGLYSWLATQRLCRPTSWTQQQMQSSIQWRRSQIQLFKKVSYPPWLHKWAWGNKKKCTCLFL